MNHSPGSFIKSIMAAFAAFLFVTTGLNAQEVIHNWRGPDRDGHYQESGLMQEWPENGPRLQWAYEELGKGFTSPVINDDKIYISGMEGETGYLYVLSLDGELLDRFPYGEEVSANYPGTRSTPTIAGDLMYVATGHGELICMQIDRGEKVWSVDLFSDFDGRNIRWGFTENLLINDDMIYASPGGSTYNIVALDRHTGELVWASEGEGGLSAYCSPLLIDHNGQEILTTMMQRHIVGLDAQNGEMLWSHPYENMRNIHPNTPIYHEGKIYYFSGYGEGGTQLSLSPDGRSITEVWKNGTVDPQLGGSVLVDGYIYGSGDRNRRWFIMDWDTGEITHETREIDKGNVIFADNRLYAYTERGELALIEPGPDQFRVAGKTEITLGSEQHWAHLVIHDGILFVRRGNALMAFDIREG